MLDYRTMVELVERLSEAPVEHRITLVDARGRECALTWRELHRKVRRHAAWLLTQGIGSGDRVIVSPTNDPDVLATFLALFYLGAVPLSVSGAQLGQASGTQLPFVASLLDKVGAKAVLTQHELVAGNDERALIPDSRLIDHMPSSLDLEDAEPDVRPADVSEDDLAFVQFSSGSTSRPKGVRITHRNVCDNVRMIARYGGRSSYDTNATWLPLYHDMGLIGTLLSCIWNQTREIVIMSPIRFVMRPISWIDRLSKIGARVTVTPNFALDLCTDRITDEQLESNQVDLSSLELYFVGAEPVRPSSIRRFEERFVPWGLRRRVLHPVYGLAESTLIVTAPDFGEEIRTRTVDGIEVPSVGRPINDIEMRIVDEQGRGVPAGKIGEICLRGTSVTDGYLDESSNADLFFDGWLRTGDLGTLDDDGRLYVTGRAKDLIIVDGKNYYSHDIVADLELLPFIERGKAHVLSLNIEGKEQMVVMTVPTGRMSDQVRRKIAEFQEFMNQGGPRGWLRNIEMAALEEWVERLISSDKTALINDIKRFVLARFGIPVHDVIFVSKIPRTSSGKVKRDACERLYLENRAP